MAEQKTTITGVHSIGAVERDTGLGKDTLRAWERRYGFPQPGRDANGERTYTPEEVAKLRLLKRLIDRGHRPGAIVHTELAQLQAMLAPAGGAELAKATHPADDDLATCLELCRQHKTDALHRHLLQAAMRIGLQRFVLDIVAPFVTAVGEYWEQGRFDVFEEHLCTEVIQNVLRNSIINIPARDPALARPRILLTTFPQEQHGLGLLMAEAMFALEGAHCVSLGVQTPVADIVQAAQGSDIVALSFSTAMNGKQVLEGLDDLAAALPTPIEIWCGGESTALRRCTLPAFRRVELDEVARQLAAWRSAHAA